VLRRKDAVVGRAVILASPGDREISNTNRIALARVFTQQHFVSKGLPVQIDLHISRPWMVVAIIPLRIHSSQHVSRHLMVQPHENVTTRSDSHGAIAGGS
jgi:hypothetical protein